MPPKLNVVDTHRAGGAEEDDESASLDLWRTSAGADRAGAKSAHAALSCRREAARNIFRAAGDAFVKKCAKPAKQIAKKIMEEATASK